MPEREVPFVISSNNHEIIELLLKNKLHPEIKFVDDKIKNFKYLVFFIDLQKELSQISQNIIGAYEHCRQNDSKLAVIILHRNKIDSEKNHYFQKMLDNLGKDNPLHRLIFIKDLYQNISFIPATPLDQYLHDSISSKKINISQKGENLLFPISIKDLISSVTKTLFLSNTQGKTFWILGDPIKDLELAFILKKITVGYTEEDLEINAEGKNDPETSILLSINNKSRGDLNWQPQDDFIDDLKQIVGRYVENPNTKDKEEEKLNIIHRLLNWFYKPRIKKNNQLPTIGRISKTIIKILIIVSIFWGVMIILFTGLSLQQLNSSIKQALNGELKQSVNSTNKAVAFKEIGESLFSSLIPIANFVSPKETEKIINIFSFINYSTTSLGNLHQTYVIAESLLLSLNNSNVKVNYSDLSLALHSNLSQVYENINQISLLGKENKLPPFLSNKLKANDQYKNLKNLEEQVVQYIKIVDIIPAILSENKTTTIVVLLQNNHVLKPSGGDIDYYLLLSLNNGKLISKNYYTKIELEKLYSDANNPAQKNKRFILPPTPQLIDFIEIPDFSISSQTMSVYIEKALKIKPDFIIATNNLLIEQLLFDEKSQILDQFKLDYLTSSGSAIYKDIVNQYLDRLFNQDLSLPVLGRTVAKIIEDNQILIWSSDKNIEKTLASQPYSGVIISHPCNAGLTSNKECFSETAYLSESQNTTSRQNPWSGRTVNHNIEIFPTIIQHEYIINYKIDQTLKLNSAISVNYHLFLPTTSTLNQVLLNDLPFSMKLVKKNIEGTIDHYEIPLSFMPDIDSTLIIKATTVNGQNFSLPMSYSITEYRQPGTVDSGIDLMINYPENLKPIIVTSQFTAKPSQLIITLPPHTSTFGFTLDANKE